MHKPQEWKYRNCILSMKVLCCLKLLCPLGKITTVNFCNGCLQSQSFWKVCTRQAYFSLLHLILWNNWHTLWFSLMQDMKKQKLVLVDFGCIITWPCLNSCRRQQWGALNSLCWGDIAKLQFSLQHVLFLNLHSISCEINQG